MGGDKGFRKAGRVVATGQLWLVHSVLHSNEDTQTRI